MRRASGNVTLLHEDNPNLVELFRHIHQYTTRLHLTASSTPDDEE